MSNSQNNPPTFLFVDLTKGICKTFGAPESLKTNFIGGRGFTSLVMFTLRNHIPKYPYSEKNVIAISSGLFAGTSFPSSGRTTIAVLKSPVTGQFADGNLGGHFGPALRQAGIDCIIITGISEKQVVLIINKKRSPFLQQSVWEGKGMTHISHVINRENATTSRQHKVLSIGPAGEMGTFSAVVGCDDRIAGGGGMGAVFGKKNLKAIIIKDYNQNESIRPKRPVNFLTSVISARDKIKSHPVYKTFKKMGTLSLVEIHAGLKYFPTKNWTTGFEKTWKKVSGTKLRNSWLRKEPNYDKKNDILAKEGKLGCRNCPIVCSNPLKIEYETINCLGPKLGVYNMKKIIEWNTKYMNHSGLDVIQTSSVIALLMELSELRILSRIEYKQKIIKPIRWGDEKFINLFLRLFATSEPLSDDMNVFKSRQKYCFFVLFKHITEFRVSLREGLKSLYLSDFIDMSTLLTYIPELKGNNLIDLNEVVDYIINHFYVNTKGNALSGVYPNRKNKGVALASATSTRGADHLRSLPTLATYASWYMKKDLFTKLKQIIKMPIKSLFVMKSDITNLFGDLYKTYNTVFEVPEEITDIWAKLKFLENEDQLEGWSSMIKFTQEVYAFSDALSICRFTSPWRFGLGPKRLQAAIYAFKETSIDPLQIGERIITMERELLYHYNNGVVDDSIHFKFLDKEGMLTSDELKSMVTEYYQMCGFDNNGRPTKEQTESISALLGFSGFDKLLQSYIEDK